VRRVCRFHQTKVAIDPYTLNFNPKYWKNPEEFDPERFRNPLDINRYAYFRFGIGQRRCLGYRFADFLMKLTVTTILSRFDMRVRGKRDPTERDSGMVNLAPRLPTFVIELVPRTTPLQMK
jgi:cytochrome P450